MTIGVLALQGGFEAHAKVLRELGHEVRYVRAAEDFAACAGLVLPGGESTVHLKLLERFAMEDALRAFVASGKPVLATCAGLILCAREVTNPAQKSFAFLDVSVERNAYGRQLDSFESFDDAGTLPMMFIRAPRIMRAGSGVEVLASLNGEPVWIREKNVHAVTFHPELIRDPRARRVQLAAFEGVETFCVGSPASFQPLMPSVSTPTFM